jgi:SAM-dependent methyltransferase
MELRALMSTDKALALIDVATARGLEIGALHRPRVSKADGPVFYVDRFTTEDLRARYQANEQTRPYLNEIVDVDFVISGSASLADVVGEAAPVDYVVASHLIEHVPNPIGWLHDVAQVLRPGGVLSLVIPDKRYCFDVNRVETQMRDWIDWYLRDLEVPTYTHLFDFFANVVTIDGTVDTAGLWAGTASYVGVRRGDVPDADRAALAMCMDHKQTGGYVDVHGAVYTPASLLSLLETTMRLGLLDFELAVFSSTERNTLEFFVSLGRVSDPAADLDARVASIHEAMRAEAARVAAHEEELHAPLEAERDVAVRERELRLQAEATIRAMTSSRSWRLTAPLRAAAAAARRARAGSA